MFPIHLTIIIPCVSVCENTARHCLNGIYSIPTDIILLITWAVRGILNLKMFGNIIIILVYKLIKRRDSDNHLFVRVCILACTN